LKGVEYRAEWREGLFPGPGFSIDGQIVAGAELFFAWYFFATALHALHLGIGVGLCAVFAVRSPSQAPARGSDPQEPSFMGNEVLALALYWHFVDIVWIVLFPLIYLVGPRS
jgi:cytochrome c oxidase subunit III